MPSNNRPEKQSCWVRRTSLEKCLTVLVLVILLIAIAVIIAAAVLLLIRKRDKCEPIDYIVRPPSCTDPGCIHAASLVLRNMDLTVNPCENFYEFACGNFVKQTLIPEGETYISSTSPIRDLVNNQLRTVSEEPIYENELKPFKLTKKLYKACMNKTLIERDGLNTTRSILKDLGGWPILEGYNWNAQNFNWENSLKNLRKIGFLNDHLIQFSLEPDAKNPTQLIINVGKPPLELDRGWRDRIVNAYYEYMVDIAVIFGANRNNARDELKDVLNFETELAEISLPQGERATLYNPITFDELQAKYPDIPWFEYLNTLLGSQSRVANDNVINLKTPQYLRELNKLMKATNKRVHASYVLWKVISDSIPFLTDNLRKRRQSFTSMITGKTEEKPRWLECIDVVNEGLKQAASALYVRKYFNQDIRQKALDIVNGIQTQLVYSIENVELVDVPDKNEALKKAKSMHFNIAYPDELLDDQKLIDFYNDLEIDSEAYLKSILNVWRFANTVQSKRFGRPISRNDWTMQLSATSLNPSYLLNENSFHLPAAILQGVLFDSERPKYMNYGTIGYLIGHELFHVFFNYLIGPDPSKCFVDQYDNYVLPELGINLNATVTLEENIADNVGAKLAYLAYNSSIEDRDRLEDMLVVRNFNQNQMFWILMANAWCAKYQPESLKSKITNDIHSPEYFRVIGPLSNLEYFANDFNCPIGNKMNPEKKCRAY